MLGRSLCCGLVQDVRGLRAPFVGAICTCGCIHVDDIIGVPLA